MTRPNEEWANDFCEIAGIMRRWRLKGLKDAYAVVRALDKGPIKGRISEIGITAANIRRQGAQDAAAGILELIHEMEGDEDELRAKEQTSDDERDNPRPTGKVEGDDPQGGAATHESRPDGAPGDLGSKPE